MMRQSITALALFGALVLGVVLHGAGPARAHFLLNLNLRVIHVEHLDDGLRVYLRLPMPYLVADRLGPVGPAGLPEPAPYPGRPLDLPMSRLDIADYLGLCVETVSRTLSTFRDAGLIDYVSPTPVILQRLGLLETIAEGDAQQLFKHANASACG